MAQAHFTTIFVGIESPRAASLVETKKTQNTREDIVTSVHRIQAAGIEVMAGMIVGFDNDDPSIFEEQFRFIQQARIPISMTGMLNALPKTPLYTRLAQAGRLVAESVGDQFVFTNIVPAGMSRRELYEGYRRLIRDLYDFRNYRERTLAFLLARGAQINRGLHIRRGDLRLLARILRQTVVQAGPKRAWFTLRLLGETLVRRPSAFKDAVSFAIVHKALSEYMEALGRHLERAIAEIELAPRTGATAAPLGGASPGFFHLEDR
jgi:hypothetical protein